MDAQTPPQPTPADVARQHWQAGARRPWWPLVAVAIAALVIGVAATLAAVRLRRGPSPGPAAVTTAAESAQAMPGLDRAATPPKPKGTGDKAVFISAARQQLIGVRTAEVEHRALETTIRTVGVLAYDETRVAEVHTKISGWIQSVTVDFVGKNVRRGQPLFTVYSPELVSTQKEYLLALKAQAQLGASRFEETRSGAGTLLAATRERLRLWDITDAQVTQLEQSGEPRKSVTVYSPFTGIVLERKAFPGQYVTPEMNAFTIADLSTIWVIGQIFEYELPLVKLGQDAQIELPYGGARRTLSGRISYVYPEVDPTTRRVKVRIELKNPLLQFKPESYVTVVIHSASGHLLAIPREAVIDTGARRYAIVALGNGYFEPRAITVGEPVNDFYPVLTGVSAGDRVVTSAQFLIDSETNLEVAMKAMANMPGMETSGDAPKKPAVPPPADMKGMDMGGGRKEKKQ